MEKIDSALVPFEKDTGEDRYYYKWVGVHTGDGWLRCPLAHECGTTFQETGFKQVRTYQGEQKCRNILCTHLVNSNKHPDIHNKSDALAALRAFEEEHGTSGIETEIETAEDRRQYRIWVWKTYKGKRPADADSEDMDEDQEEADPDAGSSQPAALAPGNKLKAKASTAKRPRPCALPTLTLPDAEVTTVAKSKGRGLSSSSRHERSYEIPDGMTLVPTNAIRALKDAVGRSRASAEQMTMITEGRCRSSAVCTPSSSPRRLSWGGRKTPSKHS